VGKHRFDRTDTTWVATITEWNPTVADGAKHALTPLNAAKSSRPWLPTRWGPDEAGTQPRRWVRPERVWEAAVAALCAVTLGAGGWSVFSEDTPVEQQTVPLLLQYVQGRPSLQDDSITSDTTSPGVTATPDATAQPTIGPVSHKPDAVAQPAIAVGSIGHTPAVTTQSGATRRSTTARAARSGSACTVTHQLIYQWPNGFQASVIVRAGAAPITRWKVRWTFRNGQTITCLWNGVYATSGGTVTVHNASYNGNIAANATVELGLTGSFTSANGSPTGLTCTGA
jgi:hypothetical protein